MTHRRREHPPRIDLSVGPVGWAIAVQVDLIQAVLTAGFRRTDNLAYRRVKAITDRPKRVLQVRGNIEAKMDSVLEGIHRIVSLATAQEGVVRLIDKALRSGALTDLHRLNEALQSRQSTVTAPSDALEDVSKWLASANPRLHAIAAPSFSIYATTSSVVSDLISTGAITKKDIKAGSMLQFIDAPDEVVTRIRSLERSAIAFFAFMWSARPESGAQPDWYVEELAKVMHEGFYAGAVLLASLFPSSISRIRADVVPADARIDIDALFAVHRFPFRRIRDLLAKEQPRAALDIVFDRLNKMLLAGTFDDVNAVLAAVPLGEEMHPLVARGFLTMTFPAHERLPNFYLLRERIRPWLTEKYGKDRATDLLKFPVIG
jgi:hypothetical protein